MGFPVRSCLFVVSAAGPLLELLEMLSEQLLLTVGFVLGDVLAELNFQEMEVVGCDLGLGGPANFAEECEDGWVSLLEFGAEPDAVVAEDVWVMGGCTRALFEEFEEVYFLPAVLEFVMGVGQPPVCEQFESVHPLLS